MKKSRALFIILGLISTISYGLNNPDSLYSMGLSGASPSNDPYGQMRNFLGIIWNFLPEHTKIQQDVKVRYAQVYKGKFHQLPIDIAYKIPPSAHIEKLCVKVKEKCHETMRKIENENKKLQNQIAPQQKTIAGLKKQVDAFRITTAKNEVEFKKVQADLKTESTRCQHDINAIQKGYGTLIAYRDAFKEKEKEFKDKVQSFISLRYKEECIDKESDHCKKEEQLLTTLAQDLKKFIPVIEQSAENLRNALNSTVNIDLEIPIKAEALGTIYTIKTLLAVIELYSTS